MKSTPVDDPALISVNGSVSTKDKDKERHSKSLHSDKKTVCEEMAQASTSAEFGGALNKLIQDYYQDVLNQARMSFYCAAAASIVATGLFLCGIYWTMQPPSKQQSPQADQTELTASEPPNSGSSPELSAPEPPTLETSTLTLIAGALVEVIAGINFYLYARTSRQLAAYHICLERTNRFLLVNSICDELLKENKQSPEKTKLIETMLNAPMLTIAQATGAIAPSTKNEKDS